MKTYTCLQCHKEFTPKGHIRGGRKPKYCSPKCYHDSKIKPISENNTYICSRCHQEKTISQFYKRSSRPNGIGTICKTCTHDIYYRIDDHRGNRLKKEYKTDLYTYNQLFEQQNGCCALCGGKEGINGRGKLALDHDHITFKVRGLLCFRCNTAIGHAEKIGIEKIITYLGRR